MDSWSLSCALGSAVFDEAMGPASMRIAVISNETGTAVRPIDRTAILASATSSGLTGDLPEGKIMTAQEDSAVIIELTADIVAAYVSNNAVPAAHLPDLISSVHGSLNSLGGASTPAPAEPLKPAVLVKKSVHDDHIVCLEDGKRFKSLKRHISSEHNMTPDEYRAKWGLPYDYPMVAPAYAAARSALAKASGLGQKRDRKSASAARKRKPA
jgi:predicted transcriptional regulator